MAVDKARFEDLIKKSSKKYYTYSVVVASITVLGIILIGTFAIKPFYNKTKVLSQELKAKKNELSYLEEKKNKLEDLKDREEEIADDAEEIRNALPTIQEVGEMLVQIDEIAVQSGGSVSDISGDETGRVISSEGETVEYILSDVKHYNGGYVFFDYFGIKNMIQKSENALRMMSFEDMTINLEKDGKFTVKLKIKAYIRK